MLAHVRGTVSPLRRRGEVRRRVSIIERAERRGGFSAHILLTHGGDDRLGRADDERRRRQPLASCSCGRSSLGSPRHLAGFLRDAGGHVIRIGAVHDTLGLAPRLLKLSHFCGWLGGSVQSDPRHGRALGPFGRYAFVCLGVAFATWIELIFARTHAAPFSLFAFCIAIALSAALGGLGPGLLALLLSAFAIDFFIIVPGGLLDFQTSTDALVFVAFCAGWLAYCVVSERASRRLDRDRDRYVNAERAAAQADRIAQVTAALSHARSPAAVVEATVQEPLHALKADAALMVLFGEDGGAAEIARAVGYRPDDGKRANNEPARREDTRSGRDRPWRTGGDRVAAILRGGVSGAAPRRRRRQRSRRSRPCPSWSAAASWRSSSSNSATTRLHDRRPRVPVHARSARRAGARSHLAARVGACGRERTRKPCARVRTRSWPSARRSSRPCARARRGIARWRRGPHACTTSRRRSPKRSPRKRSPAPSSSRGALPSARRPAK